MALHRLAEQRIAAADARGELRGIAGEGAPLPPDALDGLTGEALHEALVLRALGTLPAEAEAMREVATLESALRSVNEATRPEVEAALLRARLRATMLLERSGRMLTAHRIAGG